MHFNRWKNKSCALYIELAYCRTLLFAYVLFLICIAVRPTNQSLLVNDISYACSDEVTVDGTANNLMLKCSVESKPQATFTWSTNPALNGSLSNTTDCVQNTTSLVYTCTNTLTLPSDKVTKNDNVKVTCHAEAAGDTNDTCVTLGKSFKLVYCMLKVSYDYMLQFYAPFTIIIMVLIKLMWHTAEGNLYGIMFFSYNNLPHRFLDGVLNKYSFICEFS